MPKGITRVSLHMNQLAHHAGFYPGFSSMKRPGVFALAPGWDASPSQGYPQHLIRWYPFISTVVERGTVRVKCLSQEHNTMSTARARTQIAGSGVLLLPPLLPSPLPSSFLPPFFPPPVSFLLLFLLLVPLLIYFIVYMWFRKEIKKTGYILWFSQVN